MAVKHSSCFRDPLAYHLACWVLLIPQFFCITHKCPPPDFAEGGKYQPMKPEYDVDMHIVYFCSPGYPMYKENNTWVSYGRNATCQSNGKWSKPTFFCDVPTKLTPSSEINSKELLVIDASSETCVGPQNNKEDIILRFSFERALVPYVVFLCFKGGSGIFQFRFSPTENMTYDTDKSEKDCAFINTDSVQSKAESITVQISSKTSNFIKLCVFMVFAREDKWCDHLPENTIPHGQLEVGHSKAVLHCNEGFKEKEGRSIYATCENNTWSYQSLECVEDITVCPPPDFPERGRYEPKKAGYKPGMTIKYTCDSGMQVFGERKITCQSNGTWSGGTSFCDDPAEIRLNDPLESTTTRIKDSIIDGNLTTCFPISSGTDEFLEYSLEPHMIVYATLVCWWQGRSTIKVSISESLHDTYNYDFGSKKVGCVFFFFENNETTQYVDVQVSPDKDNSILLCEISVFAKNDVWCEHPPENSVPNSQLEVSRKKAVLHCHEGFKEKEGKEVYANCENNTWSYLTLQCIEDRPQEDNNTLEDRPEKDNKTLEDRPEKDNKTLGDRPQKENKTFAIVVGLVSFIVILTLVGLAIFLYRKKNYRLICYTYKGLKDGDS